MSVAEASSPNSSHVIWWGSIVTCFIDMLSNYNTHIVNSRMTSDSGWKSYRERVRAAVCGILFQGIQAARPIIRNGRSKVVKFQSWPLRISYVQSESYVAKRHDSDRYSVLGARKHNLVKLHSPIVARFHEISLRLFKMRFLQWRNEEFNLLREVWDIQWVATLVFKLKVKDRRFNVAGTLVPSIRIRPER